MKGIMIALGAVAAVAVALFLVWFVDVDQTEEASLPNVDVQVESGNAPEFNVETGDVQVREGEVDVPVPEVDVKVEDETVSVPTIDVDPPERDGPAGNQ